MLKLPFSYGFSHNLFSGLTPRLSNLLSLPAVITISHAFMASATHQMSSMANSGLLPKFLRRNIDMDHSNSIFALYCTISICLLVMTPMHFMQHDYMTRLFHIAVISSYVINVSYLCTFIMFQQKYSSVKRLFTNPFGLIGAGYAIFVFIVSFVSMTAFQNDAQVPIIIFVGILIFSCIYYQFSARTAQCFSEEEQKVLFVAYVINGKLQCEFISIFLLILSTIFTS